MGSTVADDRNPRMRAMAHGKNVLGGELISCSTDPITGFFRDGCCRTGADDQGLHTVCIIASDDFLAFSASCGNDLSTPMPAFHFPGLKAGRSFLISGK